MTPIGGGREGALSPITLCLGLLLLFVGTARAAVLGIDFGTLNIKAAIVKPGIPLDIVLTKDSKRKEIAAVAFKPNRDSKGKILAEAGSFPERAYGGDALALQGRLPSEVFPNLKLLLGLHSDAQGEKTASIYRERYPALQMSHDQELGTTVFKSAAFTEDVPPFSVEELIGMELSNIKRNAENMAGQGSVVEDAVITIPPFYTADEKRAIVKAANFAGLDVMALVTDGLAVGLDYAKSRTFPEVTKGEKPEYHLVFDMGAGSTSATVMRFQGKSVKDVGRFNKTVQEVTVLGAGWDRTLGGDSLNHVLMEDFVKKLLTKPVLKSRGTTEEEIKSNARVMSRFFKEAERVRQILSANTEATASFEEVLPDIDLRVKLTRAEFEKLAANHASRVASPIQSALKMAKLEMKDLSSIILHGGAIRTPFVQSQLEGVVDEKSKLRSNVNPDESAVFGAAFKAASLSASFKVKEIRASDIASYATSLVYSDKGKERKQTLFSASSPVGAGSTTKQVTFKDKEDFTFSFVQNVDETDLPVLKVKSENLTSSVSELTRRVGCDQDAMSTKFSIRLSPSHGMPDIAGGSVSCEVEDDTKSSMGDSVKGWLGLGKKKDQEPLKDDSGEEGPVEEVDATASASQTTGSETATSSDAATSSKAPETTKKRTEVINLQWSVTPAGNVQPTTEQIKIMLDRLKQFDASDKARYEREEAQNVLESYTYFVRDFLENQDYFSASTQTERDSIAAALQSTRDWMETGEPGRATKAVLTEKLDALKSLVEPIRTRRSESNQRPELLKGLQKSLDEVQKYLLKVESDSAKVASSIAKAATESSTATVAETTESPDADDLEEPETSTSSAPKSSETAVTNPYDSLDLSTVKELYDSTSAWLKERVAEQEKLKPHQDAVLTTKDLEKRANELKKTLNDLMYQVNRVTKPTVKKTKASKTKTAKKPKSTATDAEEPFSTPESGADAQGGTPEAGDSAESGEDNPDYDELLDKMKKGKKFQKPVKGGESMEDMMNWMKKDQKPDADTEHNEL
ncbi:Hypoxia up-regulated 1 [Lecanosticta acicola]|uniref:Hypoxia up-regulated 1 n=1 Tax=Lecanosticta acicola TaxID=111012 RepID=A0AAI8YS88_9PEZI|nr:Hypoxia up-regulated 1 [Lecanosticta acicola]